MNNQLKMKSPKTVKGLLSAAEAIWKGLPKDNKILQLKLSHDKFFEPIALQRYEQYMKRINHNLHVEKSGFVVDYLNCVLGATPDGKVIDLHEDPIYGMVVVKCPEEYKDVSPGVICFISKNPCIKIDENDNIILRTGHYYYNQVQYQLGVSCQSWCDFVLFTYNNYIIKEERKEGSDPY